MTDIDTGPTLAEIVTTTPAAARILESAGLDYCCRGNRSLGAACAEIGLDPDEVLDAIAALGPTPPPAAWATLGPAAMVDHLESTHHAYLHAEFDRLDALAEKVATVHGGRHPELIEIAATYRALRADLEPHLAKEERVLFPMIRDLAAATAPLSFHCGSVRNPISMMMVEHDRAGELLATLRDLTDGYSVPDDGCASYRALFEGLAELEADTHLHVHKENHLLFPAVLALESRLG